MGYQPALMIVRFNWLSLNIPFMSLSRFDISSNPHFPPQTTVRRQNPRATYAMLQPFESVKIFGRLLDRRPGTAVSPASL